MITTDADRKDTTTMVTLTKLTDTTGRVIPATATIALRTRILDDLIAMGNPHLDHPTAPLIWGIDLPPHDRSPILAFDPDGVVTNPQRQGPALRA